MKKSCLIILIIILLIAIGGIIFAYFDTSKKLGRAATFSETLKAFRRLMKLPSLKRAPSFEERIEKFEKEEVPSEQKLW